MQLYPFLFEPNLHPVVWGGNQLRPYKGLKPSDEPIGESWEVSAVPTSTSIVSNGVYAGYDLISQIMTCLNSLPDPLLTDSEAERRQYVKNNIDLLYHEFSVYAKLVGKNPEHSDYD